MAKVTKEDSAMFKSLYLKGSSTVKISKATGFSIATVNNYLRKEGVELRSNKENSRKYIINREDFFEKIDSEEKAYWLGFMAADGYLTNPRPESHQGWRVGISLGLIDKDHLIKFKECIDTSYPVNIYEVKGGFKIGVKYARILMASNKMATDLISNGVTPNKSLNISFPKEEFVPQNLQRHFIRGYFDGDGTLTATKSKYGLMYEFKITSTDDILNNINSILFENNLTHKKAALRKRNPDDVVSYLGYGGNNQVEKIMDYLYEDASIFMERKFNKYLEFKNSRLPK